MKADKIRSTIKRWILTTSEDKVIDQICMVANEWMKISCCNDISSEDFTHINIMSLPYHLTCDHYEQNKCFWLQITKPNEWYVYYCILMKDDTTYLWNKKIWYLQWLMVLRAIRDITDKSTLLKHILWIISILRKDVSWSAM